MKKSWFGDFPAALVAVLVATMLSFGGVAVRAQQTRQTDQSDTSTKSKSKSKSKTKDATGSAMPAAAATAPTPALKSAPATASTPVVAASPAPTPAAAPVSKSAPAARPAAQQQTPPANGAGTVWVNTDSGVYHKPGTRWYGKTKQGKYMTEADAQKAGYLAADKE